MVPTMNRSARIAANVLVWLAAAPLAITSTLPDNCGCQSPSRRGGRNALALPMQCLSGCCRDVELAASTCSMNSGATRCACPQSKPAPSERNRGCWSCRCGCQPSPTPPTTPPEPSRSAKEVLNQVPLATLPAADTQCDQRHPTWQDFAPLWETPLQRLSTLCRFLI